MIADKQCISQFTKYATASGLCVQSVTPSGWLTEYTFAQVLFLCTTLNIAEIIKRKKKLTSSLKGRNLFFFLFAVLLEQSTVLWKLSVKNLYHGLNDKLGFFDTWVGFVELRCLMKQHGTTLQSGCASAIISALGTALFHSETQQKHSVYQYLMRDINAKRQVQW